MEMSMSKDKISKNGDEIFNKIRQRIVNWEYPPKYPLREEALSREFNVSRSPIRKALYMLEAAEFVVHISNRGYFVNQVQKKEIRELYELRSILEVAAAEYILKHPELHDDLIELKKPWLEQRTVSVKCEKQLALIDQNFHAGIVALMDNSMINYYFKNINERLFRFRMMDFEEVLKNQNIEEVINNHIKIIDTFLQNDKENVVKQLRENINVGFKNIDISIGRILMSTYDI